MEHPWQYSCFFVNFCSWMFHEIAFICRFETKIFNIEQVKNVKPRLLANQNLRYRG